MVGPRLPRHRELVRPARAGDHARSHQLADLYRGEPHAARRPQYQQGLARLQPCLVIEGHMARAVGDLERSGIDEAHRFGQRHRPRRRKTAMVRQPALAAEHGDTGAGGGAVHVSAERGDRAGHLHAEGERRLGRLLIASLDHQQIGEVEPAGRDAQPDLAAPRLRHGDVVLRRRRSCRDQSIGPHGSPPSLQRFFGKATGAGKSIRFGGRMPWTTPRRRRTTR